MPNGTSLPSTDDLHKGVVNKSRKGRTTRADAWIDLVSLAEKAPTRVWARGRLIDLKRGQLLATGTVLQERWQWSPKAVLCFLELVERAGWITMETTGGKSRSGCRIVTMADLDRSISNLAEDARAFEEGV
jgi:hypothetical protein